MAAPGLFLLGNDVLCFVGNVEWLEISGMKSGILFHVGRSDCR
jgi:hypothetical protein